MSRIPRFRFRIVSILLAVAIVVAAVGIVRAIKTDRVELGREGVYDAQVYLERNETGVLVFRDVDNTAPLSLTDLAAGGISTHGDLNGLAADDHPQYLNATRHSEAHDQAFNEALALPADAAGNTTLGDHVTDSDVHLDRRGGVTVTGAWAFSGVTSLSSPTIGGVALDLQSPAPATGDVIQYVGENRAEWRAPSSALGVSGTDNYLVRMNGSDSLQDSAWSVDDSGYLTGGGVRAGRYEPFFTAVPFEFRTRGTNQGYLWNGWLANELMTLSEYGALSATSVSLSQGVLADTARFRGTLGAASATVENELTATSMTLGGDAEPESSAQALIVLRGNHDGTTYRTLIDATDPSWNSARVKVLRVANTACYILGNGQCYLPFVYSASSVWSSVLQPYYATSDMLFRIRDDRYGFAFQNTGAATVARIDSQGGIRATSVTLETDLLCGTVTAASITMTLGAVGTGTRWVDESHPDAKTDIEVYAPDDAWEKLDSISVKSYAYKKRNPNWRRWLDADGEPVREGALLRVLDGGSTTTFGALPLRAARGGALGGRSGSTVVDHAFLRRAGYRRDGRARLEEPEEKRTLGFLSTDLAKVDSRLVDGEGVAAGVIAAYNTAALQAAKDRIAGQARRIGDLEAMVAELTARVAALEEEAR